jgi:hypothetical protein
MPKPVEKSNTVAPFISAPQSNNTDGNTRPLKKRSTQLGKEVVTREMVKRLMNRVKRI